MSRGEIIKLGRVRLKVRAYRTENAEEELKDEGEADPINLRECDDKPADGKDQCKVCFTEANTQSNPLLSPCNCAGSMKFIHLMCLKTWLNSKLTVQQTDSIRSYFWKSFECEICKVLFPRMFCLINV